MLDLAGRHQPTRVSAMRRSRLQPCQTQSMIVGCAVPNALAEANTALSGGSESQANTALLRGMDTRLKAHAGKSFKLEDSIQGSEISKPTPACTSFFPVIRANSTELQSCSSCSLQLDSAALRTIGCELKREDRLPSFGNSTSCVPLWHRIYALLRTCHGATIACILSIPVQRGMFRCCCFATIRCSPLRCSRRCNTGVKVIEPGFTSTFDCAVHSGSRRGIRYAVSSFSAGSSALRCYPALRAVCRIRSSRSLKTSFGWYGVRLAAARDQGQRAQHAPKKRTVARTPRHG